MNKTLKVKTIILCKAIQAAGKTTWALEQIARYPNKYKRVNRDLLREMVDAGNFDPDKEKFVVSIRDHIIEKSLWKGFDVIVDDTNFNDKNWFVMCDIAKRVGNVRVMEKYFEITLKEALKRNAGRAKPIPEHAIVNMYEKYVKNKKVEVRDEFFTKIPPQYLSPRDLSLSLAIIVDIDGTLAINVDRDYYDMSNVIGDILNTPICDLVRLLSKQYLILVVSGRDESCREDTQLWLEANDIPYSRLIMRDIGDNRSDVLVKQEILQTLKLTYNIVFVLDDRLGVVNMWRENGLCCLQVAPGDF